MVFIIEVETLTKIPTKEIIIKIIETSKCPLVVTLNVNAPSSPSKDHKPTEWIKIQEPGTREMAQQLSALTPLAQGSGSFPSTPVVVYSLT